MTQRSARHMTKSQNTARSMKFMSGSAIIAQVAMVVRQFVILKVIGPENYGIAVPMMLATELLNRLLEMNPGSIVVQDKFGSTRRFRDAMQFIGVSRGFVFFLILLLLAVPLAIFNDLNTREYVMGFMFISLVPLIRGFSHVDVFRQMRRQRFGRLAFSSSATPIATTAMVLVLCLFMNSFWLPLIARFIDATLGLIMSFVIAKRKWRMRYDRQSTVRIIKFVLPLIVGGFVIFVAARGNQQLMSASDFLFGYEIPKSMVGTLAAAVTIAMMPATISSKVITQVFSSKFADTARQGGNVSKLLERVQALGFTLGAAALILLQGGAVVVPILLTNQYEAAGPFLVVLSLWSGLRVSGTTTKALALGLGRSKIIMYSNFWSLLGFAGSFWVIYNQRDLVEIAYCMGMGELISSIARCVMIKKILPSADMKTLFVMPGLVLLGALGIGIAQRYAIEGLSIPVAMLVIMVSVGVGTGALSLIWPPTRKIVWQKIHG